MFEGRGKGKTSSRLRQMTRPFIHPFEGMNAKMLLNDSLCVLSCHIGCVMVLVASHSPYHCCRSYSLLASAYVSGAYLLAGFFWQSAHGLPSSHLVNPHQPLLPVWLK